MNNEHPKQTHIVILGGGFGGVYTARHLERLWARADQVRITLISRDNYFLITPLLFEAGSGVLEPRHAVAPIRPLLSTARFIEAEVNQIDMDRQTVRLHPTGSRELDEVPYDHLILALGGITNTSIIPGGDRALTFKTMGDAIFLRNHVIKLFEWADVESDPKRKAAQLTFIVVGAGFVGLELMGELTEFVFNVARLYRHVEKSELRFEMIEAGPKIAPEFDDTLAEYSARVLKGRGVNIRTNTKVKSIDATGVELPDGQRIDSQTVVIATGVSPSPLLKTLAIERDQKGRVRTEATMRAIGRQNVWALGDCAEIPDPSGKPYPPLAQHFASGRQNVWREISPPSFAGRSLNRLFTNPKERWRHWVISKEPAKFTSSISTASSPGGYGAPITSSRCRSGAGGCASSSTGPSPCFSVTTWCNSIYREDLHAQIHRRAMLLNHTHRLPLNCCTKCNPINIVRKLNKVSVPILAARDVNCRAGHGLGSFDPSANTNAKGSLVGSVFGVAGVALVYWFIETSPYVTLAGQVRQQPIPFSHAHHVGGLGIDCRYCHTSVEDSSFAGIPPTKTCMTCHSVIWNNAEMLDPVRQSWRNNQPISWQRVHNLPRYVYFDHSIHINKGIGCATCHGQVDEMPLMYQKGSLQMAWCLDCHRQPERFIRPREEGL